MTTPAQARPEAERIEFLLHRDGYAATRAWVERTLKIYRDAIAPGQHGSTSSYRPLFEKSIREFDAWLALASNEDSSGSAPGPVSAPPSSTRWSSPDPR